MRILHVASSYFPRVGGLPNWVRAVAHHTPEFEHYLATRTRVGPKENMPPGWDRSDPLLTVRRFLDKGEMPTVAMRDFVASFDYDVLALAATNPKTLELAKLAPRTVLFAHTPNVARWKLGEYWEHVERVVVFLSSYVQLYVQAGVPWEKVTVIPRLVDAEQFEWRAKADLGPRRLLYVGRFAPEKRAYALFDTLANLRGHGGEYTLRLVGKPDHPDRDDPPLREALTKSKMAHAVSVHTVYTVEELAEEYAGADVFLSASWSETFCQAFLEALASGLAVLATAKGSCREWAAPFVRFVDDVTELADAVRYGTRGLEGRAYNRFVQRYSWASRGAEIAAVLAGRGRESICEAIPDRMMTNER